MTEEQEPIKATERYRRTLDGYKSRLATDPDLHLKEYCNEVYCNYRLLLHWCSRHGISIVAMRREVLSQNSVKSSTASNDPGMFVQVRPALPNYSISPALKGISITFPDGINLTLQECQVEELVSLLNIYQQRKGGE